MAEKTEGRERSGWGRNQATKSISGSFFYVSLGSKRRDNVLSLGPWLFGSARLPIESTKVIYKNKSC